MTGKDSGLVFQFFFQLWVDLVFINLTCNKNAAEIIRRIINGNWYSALHICNLASNFRAYLLASIFASVKAALLPKVQECDAT